MSASAATLSSEPLLIQLGDGVYIWKSLSEEHDPEAELARGKNGLQGVEKGFGTPTQVVAPPK